MENLEELVNVNEKINTIDRPKQMEKVQKEV